MKPFVKNVLWFLFILLLVNLAVYFGFTKRYLHNPYQTKGIQDGLEAVLFADSHGGVLNRKALKEFGIFKFTSSGDSYADIYAKLTYYHRQNPNLKRVFLTVDDHTLSYHKDNKNNNALSIAYLDQRTYKTLYQANGLDFIFDKYLKYHLPLLDVNNAGIIKFALLSKYRSTFNKDYGKSVKWSEKEGQDRKLASERRKQEHFPEIKKSKHLEYALNLIMEYCQANGLEVIGMKYPLDGTYVDVLDGVSYKADDYVTKSGFKVIDLRDAYLDQPQLFINQDHLNRQGASVFLDSLQKRLFSLELN